MAVSCVNFRGGGSFEGCLQKPNEISLKELGRYYDKHSNGKIKLAEGKLESTDTTLRFKWDPYRRCSKTI